MAALSRYESRQNTAYASVRTFAHPLKFEVAVSKPYAAVMAKPKKAPKALMLGLGLDSDGHKRVTTGPNFALLGGSKDTHDAMTEKAVKINEKLARKGKTLETVSAEEFDDVAHEVGLKRHEPQRN